MTEENIIKTGMNKKDVIHVVLWISVILIAILLRFVNLENNPGWYSDEGTLVEIAKNILNGRFQYLAINKSTLLAARLPLFPTLLAGVFCFTSIDITILRIVSASLGVLSVGMLIWVVEDIVDTNGIYLGLTAGFFLAIYPPAILYSRLGFSYNLLAPIVIGLLWLINKYLKTRQNKWIFWASLLIGIGGISDLVMFAFVPAIFLIVFYVNWKALPVSAVLMLLPFGLYALIMFTFQKEAFLFDFGFTFFRLGEIPFLAQFPAIMINYGALLIRDYWWSLGVIGLILINESRFRNSALIIMFAPVFVLGRTTALPGLGYYYLSPIFPIIALGASSLLVKGFPFLLKQILDSLNQYLDVIIKFDPENKLRKVRKLGIFVLSSLVIFVIGLSPFVMTTFLGFYQSYTSITSEIDPVLVNTGDARNAIDYVNKKVDSDELVIASPALAWAIEANVADFQMAVAYDGGNTKHFPSDIPSNRFAFDVSYQKAAFVIIDPIWLNWAVPNMKSVNELVQEIKSWPLVYSSGEVDVFQNPEIGNE